MWKGGHPKNMRGVGDLIWNSPKYVPKGYSIENPGEGSAKNVWGGGGEIFGSVIAHVIFSLNLTSVLHCLINKLCAKKSSNHQGAKGIDSSNQILSVHCKKSLKVDNGRLCWMIISGNRIK